MINYESLAIARLMSRNSSKWTESVRRTAGQLALRAGQRRTAAQVLTRLVNLVNARTEDGTLRQRCELALEWLQRDEAVIRDQFLWGTEQFRLAGAILALIPLAEERGSRGSVEDFEELSDQFSQKALREAYQLARILSYTERLLNFVTEQRRQSRRPAERVFGNDPAWGAERLWAESDLYCNLPGPTKKWLEQAVEAA